ncbi:DnaJ domain-containing protein [Marinobacter halophilus]|uniref:Molecular chaperone DnaJ n=1 Tax=Marinobacter halophilus TaxID=1323740 RepID=A0A2T1KD38_9GAMM|nr:DnaJ domain-containing protein [Marinobacter halophilus]PSF08037.1 molecular chaperone DnaJ [Marinobacter halophilus]GGC59218.1 molecular chaperone DnaJ [Marinobacter halophilus]
MPLITLLVIVLSVVAWVWLRNQPASQRKPAMIKLALMAGIGLAAVLAVTGRLHFLVALLAGLFPLLRRVLPSILSGGTAGRAKAKPGNQSHVSSDILEMSLDHDSETMTGNILKGPMAGRALADLGESEFIELLRYCREQDEDSARLLETYLDRRFGDSWRADDQADAGRAESGASNSDSANAGGPLTDSEAQDILGVEPGASREEIIQAHRRMMQKMHPDRGGSNYLAARVNEAKERLLS